MAPQQITGSEVIGTPGQNLDERELRYLVGLADGDNTAQLTAATGVQPHQLAFVEASIRNKLGARNKSHMLARAFTLGVLQTRALVAFGLLAALIGMSSFLYFKQQRIPSDHGGAAQYDTMAGQSAGAIAADPRYLDILMRRNHRS